MSNYSYSTTPYFGFVFTMLGSIRSVSMYVCMCVCRCMYKLLPFFNWGRRKRTEKCAVDLDVYNFICFLFKYFNLSVCSVFNNSHRLDIMCVCVRLPSRCDSFLSWLSFTPLFEEVQKCLVSQSFVHFICVIIENVVRFFWCSSSNTEKIGRTSELQ